MRFIGVILFIFAYIPTIFSQDTITTTTTISPINNNNNVDGNDISDLVGHDEINEDMEDFLNDLPPAVSNVVSNVVSNEDEDNKYLTRNILEKMDIILEKETKDEKLFREIKKKLTGLNNTYHDWVQIQIDNINKLDSITSRSETYYTNYNKLETYIRNYIDNNQENYKLPQTIIDILNNEISTIITDLPIFTTILSELNKIELINKQYPIVLSELNKINSNIIDCNKIEELDIPNFKITNGTKLEEEENVVDIIAILTSHKNILFMVIIFISCILSTMISQLLLRLCEKKCSCQRNQLSSILN